MTIDLNKYQARHQSSGFLKALLDNDEDMISFASSWVDIDHLICIYSDDTKENEFNAVQAFSEEIWEEDSEIYTYNDDFLVYVSSQITVLFVIRNGYSVALWDEKTS